MGIERSKATAPASQPLFAREPSWPEVQAMANLMGTRMSIQMDGVTAITILSLLQRHQRDVGGINPRATTFAWALRDMIAEAEPQLQQLIDGGWAGVPLKRQNS